MRQPIPVSTPHITEADTESVSACLRDGWVSSEGPHVTAFESSFATAFERGFGVAVSSGTAALHVAVRAIGLEPGDEVLVPSLTIISCASAIVEAGATPVPVDCDPADWNAHLTHFDERRTSRTRAVMLVHLYGLCSDLAPILEWAEQHGLMVIEDASQATGLSYRQRPCGSFGLISVFSLYANKLITTGEGGMILCDDENLAARCRSLRNLCFDPARRFVHEELGWNYRMTAMQAALGASQLQRLDALARAKRAQGLAYHAALREAGVFHLAPPQTAFAENVYWVFGVVLTRDSPFTRADLISALAAERIGARTFFFGLHSQPALLDPGLIEPVTLPTTEILAARGMYLPGGAGLSPEDQQRVIDVVLEFVQTRS
jgi:perosamine synthetase